MSDSPFVNRLRSNPNYRQVDAQTNKSRNNRIKIISKKNDEDENFLANILIEDNDVFFKENVVEEVDIKPVQSVESLTCMFNKLAMEELGEETWELQKSQKGGYKLFSLGYGYLVEKPSLKEIESASTVYWKCDKWKTLKCPARGTSFGLSPPFSLTKPHLQSIDHVPNPIKKDENRFKTEIKNKAKTTHDPPRSLIRESQQELTGELLCYVSKKEAITKMIIRERKKCAGDDMNINYHAKCIEDLVVPQSLHYTKKDQLFYFEDSGQKRKDKSRVMVFTTEFNLNLLNSYSEWYADGTFDISPSMFKQIYTIHIRVNGTTLPLVYGILPDKKQNTYVKFLRLIKKHVTNNPRFVNCDFEKAAINAFKKVFQCEEIHGCFFHLSQAWYRRIQSKIKEWNKNENFRITYRKLQALAFLPVDDVSDGFKLISKKYPSELSDLVSYIEKNYIGNDKPARFPIDMWNLHERVKQNLPRTNNNVEAWHSRIKPDVRNNLSLAKVVELLLLEQSNMESDYAKVSVGEILSKSSKKQIKKNQNIKCLIDQYDKKRIDLFIEGMSKNLMD